MIISDNQAETCLIITINDTFIGDLPLIITISETVKNQLKWLDFDNTINLSSLIVNLEPEEEIDDEETEVTLLNHHLYHHMGQKLEKSVRMFCMSASKRVNQWVGSLRQAKI